MMRPFRWVPRPRCPRLVGQADAADLTHWPKEAAGQLDAMIAANANKGAYAVFDMDNTSYRYDLTEALLPFLEMKGVLTRETLDPSLKLIPFKDKDGQKESLNSYYNRLCELDDLVCYPWIAQSFSGLTLAQLKGYLDEMMSAGKPIPTTVYDGDTLKKTEINPPKLYRGIQELFAKLRENGIEVYIMTARTRNWCAWSPRIRATATTSTGERDRRHDAPQGPRHRRADDGAQADRRGALRPEGQHAARDHPVSLDAGDLVRREVRGDPHLHRSVEEGRARRRDTPKSDGYMLLHGVDTAKGGLRLWVDRKSKYRPRSTGCRRPPPRTRPRSGCR